MHAQTFNTICSNSDYNVYSAHVSAENHYNAYSAHVSAENHYNFQSEVAGNVPFKSVVRNSVISEYICCVKMKKKKKKKKKEIQ